MNSIGKNNIRIGSGMIGNYVLRNSYSFVVCEARVLSHYLVPVIIIFMLAAFSFAASRPLSR